MSNQPSTLASADLVTVAGGLLHELADASYHFKNGYAWGRYGIAEKYGLSPGWARLEGVYQGAHAVFEPPWSWRNWHGEQIRLRKRFPGYNPDGR